MTADKRPDYCCGVCPPIEGGGYDCTCRGNPRCHGPEVRSLLARNRILEDRIEELLGERAALQAALRNEFRG